MRLFLGSSIMRSCVKPNIRLELLVEDCIFFFMYYHVLDNMPEGGDLIKANFVLLGS